MDRTEVTTFMTESFYHCDGNRIPAEKALEGCAGLEIFEEPVIGMADAADPLFDQFKKEEIIGEPFMKPTEWLPEAKTVIAFFLPFQERVRASNRNDPQDTSNEWLHARIDGQVFLNTYLKQLGEWFREQKAEVCIPSLDPRFRIQSQEMPEGDPEGLHFSSTWSERHAAYAAGIGTFALSKGVITKKGMAGRFGSLIISEALPADKRPYRGPYEYCIRCGACVRACPVGAISLEQGKNQKTCWEWVENVTKKRYAPYYGCGKCQVGVPCEAGNPSLLYKS